MLVSILQAKTGSRVSSHAFCNLARFKISLSDQNSVLFDRMTDQPRRNKGFPDPVPAGMLRWSDHRVFHQKPMVSKAKPIRLPSAILKIPSAIPPFVTAHAAFTFPVRDEIFHFIKDRFYAFKVRQAVFIIFRSEENNFASRPL